MDYVSESELIERLKLSRYTLWQLRRDGLPFLKIRGRVRYVPEDVDAWLSVHCQGKKLSTVKHEES
jgi:predicted DNA-binding transcriptional regulator AlpA